MSSSAYATPLVLEPRPSRWLLSLTLFAHGGAIAVLLALDAWSWWLRLLPVLPVLVALWLSLGRLGWRDGDLRIRRLVWQTGNEWRLETGAGEARTASLLPSSVVHPWLVVLHLRVEGYRLPRAVVLAPDSLDDMVFRRLRVRLTIDAGTLFTEQ